jgi:hypothetical protein
MEKNANPQQRGIVGIYVAVEIFIGLLNTFSVKLLDLVGEVSGAWAGGVDLSPVDRICTAQQGPPAAPATSRQTESRKVQT